MNKYNEELLQKASNLKQQWHKEHSKADWSEIEEILTSEGFDVICDENFRCAVKRFEKQNGILKKREEYINQETENKLSEIDLQLADLKKEKYKLQDQKTEYNRILREQSRWEVLIDSIVENAKIISKEKPFVNVKPTMRKTNKTGIIQLSDWHYSLVANNFLNEYNIDIFEDRINKIVDKTVEYGCIYDIEELYVLLQGDFISSSIHNILRIQNQKDIIEQIMKTSEVLSEIISELSNYFKIKVAIVTDNHSRVTPDKNDSLNEESYIRLTEWYLKTRLENNDYVEFLENEYGLEIASFNIYDYKCGVVHGHNDKPSSIVQNISTFTRDVYDVIYTAHNHHPYIEEINMCTIVGNGSLCGVDAYSASLRKTSYPSQNFSVIDKYEGLKSICPIKV